MATTITGNDDFIKIVTASETIEYSNLPELRIDSITGKVTFNSHSEREFSVLYSDLTTINGVTKPGTLAGTVALLNSLKNGVKTFKAAAVQAITTGSTAQTAIDANTAGNLVTIVNLDQNLILWISLTGTAAPNTSGSIPLQPYAAFDPGFAITNAVSVYSTLAGHKFTALTA